MGRERKERDIKREEGEKEEVTRRERKGREIKREEEKRKLEGNNLTTQGSGDVLFKMSPGDTSLRFKISTTPSL